MKNYAVKPYYIGCIINYCVVNVKSNHVVSSWKDLMQARAACHDLNRGKVM